MSDLATAAKAAASTEIQPKEDKGLTLRDLLEKQQESVKRALPTHVPAGPYMRAIFTDLRRTPKLLATTPQSFFGAIMTAAQLGLTPGPALGECYLIPFKDQTQLIIGYRGYLALARKSGLLISIVSRERCENDQWEFEYGLEEKLRHIPAEGNRGAVVGYYGVAQFKDGGHLIHYMTIDDIDKRRNRSQAKNDGPWTTDYDAMARKTVIRAMAPFLPMSSEMAQAYSSDGAVIDLHGEELTPHYVDSDENVVDAEIVEKKESVDESKGAAADQINTMIELMDTVAMPTDQRKAFVQEIIGRNIRGFTTLTEAEIAKIGAALEVWDSQQDELVADEPVLTAVMEENTLKRLQILFKESGITDREIRLIYIQNIIGREVATSKELTEAEGRLICEHLEADVEDEKKHQNGDL